MAKKDKDTMNDAPRVEDAEAITPRERVTALVNEARAIATAEGDPLGKGQFAQVVKAKLETLAKWLEKGSDPHK